MKVFLILAVTAMTFSAAADGIENDADEVSYKVESVTTEPTPLPDPVDQPPVLDYGKSKLGSSQQRAPSSLAPQKYIDAELGIACYYILPQVVPGVSSPQSPAISCVPYQPKIIPVLTPQSAQLPQQQQPANQ